ncbi:MAG: protein translocase subunit SecD [Candidatus Schekmanbacteria bacterium]|nr:protein translocase subunit SecD [Candidatus Schekmanbacteria bacterium]
MQSIKKRLWLVLALVIVAFVYVTPSIFSLSGGNVPEWWQKLLPTDKVHLGLDLQGGMHLILGVRDDKAVESVLAQNSSDMEEELKKAGIPYKSIAREGENQIRITLFNAQDKDKLDKTLETYAQFESAAFRDGELTGALLTMRREEVNRIKDYAIRQSLETIRNRIDQFGVSEPTIQRQGSNNILVQLPGIKDSGRAIALIGKTALLEFKLLDEENSLEAALAGTVPPGSEIRYQKEVDPATGKVTKTPFLVQKKTLMTGDVITDAMVNINDQFGDSYVSITFDKRGERLFARITEANVKKRLAIVLDGNVYSAPMIQEKIESGRAQITGRFTVEEARDLAIVLRVGALPAPVEILEERTVGPSLGRDSIQKGLLAAAIGSAFVFLFMIIYYRLSGIVANIALLLDLLFIFAALAAFKATLTLPGIAGIALTIGMGVDANILIYERIREELITGKMPRAAVDSGYDKAFSSILDSNLTTLIAAAVLYQFGTGPIRGFAVTLSLGILASMFTAIIVTKMIFDMSLQGRKVTSLSI